MSQITGTITFTTTGLIYAEHLSVNLCFYDSDGLKQYANVISTRVYKDFTYEIEVETKDLDSSVQHFIEVKYAEMSVRTAPTALSTLLTPPYSFDFFSLNFYLEVKGKIYTTRGVLCDSFPVVLEHVELIGTPSITVSTTTNSDGEFFMFANMPTTAMIPAIDPEIYPEFIGNGGLHFQIRAEDPNNSLDPYTYSDVFYDVREKIEADIVVGDEDFAEKPDLEKKLEIYDKTAELDSLTLAELEEATTKVEYLSKCLRMADVEAKKLINTKYFSTKFTCNESVAFAILRKDPDRDYKDVLFTASDVLESEVNDAIASNFIDEIVGKGASVSTEVATMKANLITEYLSENEVSDKFTSIGITLTADQTSIVEAEIDFRNSLEHQQNYETLNDYLLANTSMNQTQYEKAVVFDKIGEVSGGSHDLSVAVLTDKTWTSIDDIIANADDLTTVITSNSISLPDEYTTAEEYKDGIKKELELRHPSHYLKNEIVKPGNTTFLVSTKISTFITNNYDFQFGENHAMATLLDPNIDWTDISTEEREQLQTDLQKAEQLYKLTPDKSKSTVMEALWGLDLCYSYKISRKGKTAFKNAVSDELGSGTDITEEDIDQIFAKASKIANASLLTILDLGIGIDQSPTPVTPSYSFDSEAEYGTMPTLNEMFGSQDYFEYPKCRTLFSQSAYLADLLNFLADSADANINELFSRRPDIEYILLNCTNTENVLPHIDLVNEILEKKVIDLYEGDVPSESLFQTTWTNEELAAYPENLQHTKDAYEFLTTCELPWSLPFNLWLEEYRSYLSNLGISRERIINLFTPGTGSDIPLANENNYESLGLTNSDVSIITTSESGTSLSDRYNGTTPTGNVKEFIDLTSISYEHLNELLDSYFINPVNVNDNRYYLYTIPGYDNDPNTTEQPGTLESTYIMNDDQPEDTNPQPSPAESFYDRLHRFERLRKKLDIKVFELDLIMQYLDFSDLTSANIIKISDVIKLKAEYGLKLEETLLLFGDFIPSISYNDYINLYDYLFLKKTEEYDLKESFQELINGETPTNTNFTFSNFRTFLPFISGIKIPEEQYLSIIDGESIVLGNTPTLADLSKILRVAYICDSLDISTEEYYFLTGISSLDVEIPAELITFSDLVNKVKANGFSIPDLAYFVESENVDGNTLAISEEFIIEKLTEIRDSIKPTEISFYEEYVSENAYNLFKTYIDQAIGYVFYEITDDATTVSNFVTAHPDLFPNFNSVDVASILNSNTGATNEAIAAKVTGVLQGLSIITGASDTNLKNFSKEEDVKSIFINIKATVLKQILGYEDEISVSLKLNKNQKFKYSGSLTSLDLYNVIPTLITIEYTGFNIGSFISNNTEAFPSGFSSPNYLYPYESNSSLIEDVSLRFKTYFYDVELSVFDERIDDIRTLMEKYLEEDIIEKCVTIVLNEDVEGLTGSDLEEFVGESFECFMPRIEAINQLYDTEHNDYLENPYDRIDLVLNYLKQEQRVDIIKDLLIEEFEIPELYITDLLLKQITYTDTETYPAINSFIKSSFLDLSEIDNTNSSEQIGLYRMLYKTAMLINGLKLTNEMVSSIYTIFDEEIDKYDLLNIFNPENSTDALTKYCNLLTAVNYSHSYFADETDFFSFFIENDDFSSLGSDSVEFICAATGCNEDDFTAMNTVILPEDLYINWFESLIECTHVVKSLGTKAQTIIDLNKTDSALTYEHSENLRQIVKSKYSEDDWYSVASAIRNPLRELQRNALRDCIVLKDSSIDSAEDLYNILLIDPEMATCAKTSRIVQATLSAQLFIQRILMGLEDGLSFNDDQKAELEWRKSYRVWEANRKILFFPENWLDPELRHNKSPFFKEVEERLLQNDVDENTVLDAYYEYLDKLDEVSNLEILCAYRDGNIANESQTTHFIGRTYGIPYKYFYRKLVNNSYWTPWEEIQNGMKADAVKLAFWKGDLYMFWPELYMTSQVQEGFEEYYSAYELNNENQNQFTAVKLTWSVYKNGNWTKPVTSEDVYIEPQNRGKLTNYQLNIYPQSDIIKIRVSFDQDVQDENSCWRTATRGNFVFNGRRISFDYQRTDCGSFDRIYFNSTGKKKTKNNKLLLQRDGSAGPNFAISYTHIVGENNEFDTTPLPFYLFIRSGIENDVKYNIIYDNISYYMWDWRLKIDYRNAWYKPFVLEDIEHNKNFLSIPYLTTPNYIANTNASNVKYKIVNLYYPFVNDIREKLNNLGLNGLFSSEFQDQEPRELFYNLKVNGEDTNADFNSYFGAIDSRVPYTPEYEELVFTPSEIEDSPAIQDPYAIYNWEMFFHIPMLIADNLSRNMKFEEARKWYHLIFDPTIGSDNDGAPKKFWKIKPFRDLFDEDGGMSSPENVSDFMNMINSENAYDELISAWEDSPFNPHLVATLRPMSYMRSVVMKYVENLINWADMLFTKDTMEDINQATLLYILASEILGVKPQKLEGTLSDAMSYYDMKNEMDDLSNVYTMIDGILTVAADHNNVSTEQTAEFGAAGYMVSYFGIPNNSKMEEYWDTVADRLFKIRHCMNIQGIVRELPLAAPPIDPGAVAAAIASGADLSSALSTLSAPLPLYRFNYILQKAIEFTNDVKSLGNTMLSVLEKKDAEAMSLLRSANEQLLLKAMTIIREKAIEEANESLNSLAKTRENISSRLNYYSGKKRIYVEESKSISLSQDASGYRQAGTMMRIYSSIMGAIPQLSIPPRAEFGGMHLANIYNALASVFDMQAEMKQSEASQTGTNASYDRRYEDWQFQSEQAKGELLQIDKQIASSNVRLAMAEKELENHLVQIEHRAAEYEFIKGKFTNKELYNWMKGQVSKLYQDAYKMAHKLALAAEKAYIFERQKDNYTSIISSGHWDGLKQGLLSGEKLSNELRKLELEYIENNTREIELSRDIPLSLIAPNALVELQTKGSCEFDIPEMLYDIDHPGHYLRRIKGVSISIPAVTGPYSGVTCKLNLLNNRFRKSTSVSNGYAYSGIDDNRFIHNIIGIQSIATSTGNNDTGMFEFNFRDERYLPFEGAGAVGKWSIELPTAIRKFDYESISDVILHVKYTARDAGGTLKTVAEENIEDNFNQLMEVLGDTNSKLVVAHSLKSEFADAIYELINSTEGTLEISEKHFPYIFRNWASKYGKAITISSIKLMSDTDYSDKLFVGATTGWTTESLPFYYNGISVPTPSDGVWSVDLNSANFDGNNDVYLVIEFSFV